MSQIHEICEACQQSLAQTLIESEVPQQPYRLCFACADRLQKRNLRPLEWFNLAAIHSSHKFLLHDDFYFNNGIADQPLEPVQEPERYPAPTLEQISNEMERLIDYAMAQFSLEDQNARFLEYHDKAAILESLKKRVETAHNVEIERRAYQICAQVLRGTARQWIEEQWQNNRAPYVFHALVEATAYCLPPEEGLDLVFQELEKVPPKDRSHACTALAWFRSEQSLGWIESHIDYPITDDWGRLAAVSHVSWNTIVRWLDHGRPLSLVAIDALYFCTELDTAMLKSFAPKLVERDSIKNMTAMLNQYANKDPAPRVERRIGVIVNNWDRILAT